MVRKFSMVFTLFMVLMLPIYLPSGLQAQIVQYIDEQGRRIFVDDISKVPPAYRDQFQSRSSEMTPERREEMELNWQNRQNEQQRQNYLRQLDQAIEALHTPVKMWGNSVMVPVKVTLRGRSVNTMMIFDTGASSTVFHREKLGRLPIDPRPSGHAQVASGDVVETFSARFDRIEIGPYQLNSPRALIIDFKGGAPYDGLLGMDFLRQVEYRIDFNTSQIIWNPGRVAELQQQRAELVAAMAVVDQ